MNVLSVMAHQDDELICLGTMLKMRDRGDRLHFICVTDGSKGIGGQPSLPRKEAAEIREREMTDLAQQAGGGYAGLGEPDVFLTDTQDIRMRLLQAMRAFRPDIVFTHSTPDFNVDHMTVNVIVRQCAMALPLATLHTSAEPCPSPAVFLVEPSGGFEFDATHYVDVTPYAHEKRRLAKCHQSQDELFQVWHGYGLGEWVERCSIRRGEECGVPHAEAFRPMLARKLVKAIQLLP